MKTHSFIEAVYLKRKKCNKKQKIKLFLKQRIRKTFKYAPTAMLTNYLKLTSYKLTYTVTLNFVLKMLINNKLINLNLFEKFGWDLDNFHCELEGGGSTSGNEQQERSFHRDHLLLEIYMWICFWKHENILANEKCCNY